MSIFHLTEQRQQKHFYEVMTDFKTITVRDKIDVDNYDRRNNTMLELCYPRLTEKGKIQRALKQTERPK